MATCNKSLGAVVLAILLGVLNSQFLFAQLHSGGASVLLIARLESLSVSATSAVPTVLGAGSAITDSQQVAVRTSWAVPANRTTVRLIGGLSDGSQVVAAGKKALNSGSIAAAPSARGKDAAQPGPASKSVETLCPGEAGQTLMSQRAESNRADSRTSHINLEFGRGKTSEAGFGGNTATFSVQVEAL
jgi:hypothetical protein